MIEDKYSVIKFKNDSILINQIVELWNHEVGFIFPFSVELFKQKTVECKFIDYEASYLVFDDINLVGFVIAKVYDNNEIMSKYINKGWISLLYIARKYRKQGIGSYLLELVEKQFNKKGIKEILFGSDYDNFFPGIPNDFDNLTEPFLTKRGYSCGRYTHDLVRTLDETVFSEDIPSISMRYANENDKDLVLEFFKSYFYGRWYYEALEYFDNCDIKEEYLIAFDGEVMTGFLRVNKQKIRKISYNLNWKDRFKKLVGIGPLGVRPDYRRRKIAKALINKALQDCYKEKYSDALIDWTGLMEIYQKYYFEVWKCYQYASKKL